MLLLRCGGSDIGGFGNWKFKQRALIVAGRGSASEEAIFQDDNPKSDCPGILFQRLGIPTGIVVDFFPCNLLLRFPA
jgi:hypothetical protein